MKSPQLPLTPIALLAVTLLIACSRPAAPPTPATYSDPFAYCAAVGTADVPDSHYTGPPLPESVISGIKKALDMPADVPSEVLQQGTFWRCMKGQVYACFVGANLPCQAKANTDRMPTQAEKEFCQQTPDAEFIPMAVTGHEGVYEWRCNKRQPEIVRQFAQPDERGFLSHIWYPISPQRGEGTRMTTHRKINPWDDLRQVRARWQAVEAEERRLHAPMSIQDSLRQWLALQRAFEPQLQQTEAIFRAGRLAYLEELQRRLASLGEKRGLQRGESV